VCEEGGRPEEICCGKGGPGWGGLRMGGFYTIDGDYDPRSGIGRDKNEKHSANVSARHCDLTHLVKMESKIKAIYSPGISDDLSGQNSMEKPTGREG